MARPPSRGLPLTTGELALWMRSPSESGPVAHHLSHQALPPALLRMLAEPGEAATSAWAMSAGCSNPDMDPGLRDRIAGALLSEGGWSAWGGGESRGPGAWARGLAVNPRCPAELLERMAKEDLWVRAETGQRPAYLDVLDLCFRNPSAPPALLEEAAGVPALRGHLAVNGALPLGLRLKLNPDPANWREVYGRSSEGDAVARYRGWPRDFRALSHAPLPPEIQAEALAAAGSSRRRVLRALAGNPWASEETLRAALDEFGAGLPELMRSPGLSEALQEEILRDPSAVPGPVSSPRATDALLRRAYAEGDRNARLRAAHHPWAPGDVLADAARSPDAALRLHAAANPCLRDPATMRALASARDCPALLLALAEHPLLTDAAAQGALRDCGLPAVIRRLSHNPSSRAGGSEAHPGAPAEGWFPAARGMGGAALSPAEGRPTAALGL